jgi:ADP-heptose:LPS heptosyltransferase
LYIGIQCTTGIIYCGKISINEILCLQVKALFQTSSQEVLTDIAALMITNDTVAMDIAIALGESSSNILLGKRVSHK